MNQQSASHKIDIDVSSFNFHRAWELQEGSTEIKAYAHSDKELQKSRRARIAKYVAATAEASHLNFILRDTITFQPNKPNMCKTPDRCSVSLCSNFLYLF